MIEANRLRKAIKVSAVFSMIWALGLTLAIFLTVLGMAKVAPAIPPVFLGLFVFTAAIIVAIFCGAYRIRPWAKFILTALLILFAWVGVGMFGLPVSETLPFLFPIVVTTFLLWRVPRSVSPTTVG